MLKMTLRTIISLSMTALCDRTYLKFLSLLPVLLVVDIAFTEDYISAEDWPLNSNSSSSSSSSCISGCSCRMMHSRYAHQELKTLNCSFTNMKSLPDNLPTDIQALNASGNSIFHVLDSITKLTDLREVDLSRNRIKSIGRGRIFQNMTRLIHLNLGKNFISTIFHDNLIGPTNLVHLILSNNNINDIEDEAFNDLKSLQTLDLERNLLGSLYAEWFHGLDQLVALSLNHNKIHNIPASVFHSLVSLERLHLLGNRISQVDPRGFSGLTKLQVLIMGNNLLCEIPEAAFQSLPSLDTLILDNNPLTKIQPLDFSHLSIRTLTLNHMPQLRIIDAKAFYSLANITVIQITHNSHLAYIDPLAFINVSSLQELELQENRLQGIQKEMSHHLPTGVKLSLYGNPLTCDCNVRWLRQLMESRENIPIIINKPEHISCQSPPELAHKILKDLTQLRFPKTCSPTVLNLTQSEIVKGKVGDRQFLECRALGSPPPQIHWILPDGSVVNSSLNEVRRHFFLPGSLVFYHLKPTDEGLYTCIAENSVGSVNSSIYLNITGIDIHLFPVRVSSNFVTLVWNGTERRAFPMYKIVYTQVDTNGSEVGDKRFSMASPSRKTFTISHLTPDSNYSFCIGYEDPAGYWLQISCCFIRTQDGDFMMYGITHTSYIAVAGMIGLILVMTMVVCLISVVSRSYHQRNYENPDKVSKDDGYIVHFSNLYHPILKTP